MDRVLSASAWVWVEGADALPQGREHLLPLRVADAVAAGRGVIEWSPKAFPKPAEESKIVLVAVGDKVRLTPELIQVAGCSSFCFKISGLVTTAPEVKLDGYLVRERGDNERRRWLFAAGMDGLPLVLTMGLFHDPVIDGAGFISVPADQVRARRKQILGFGGAQ
jgi:hypothetical protein